MKEPLPHSRMLASEAMLNDSLAIRKLAPFRDWPLQPPADSSPEARGGVGTHTFTHVSPNAERVSHHPIRWVPNLPQSDTLHKSTSSETRNLPRRGDRHMESVHSPSGMSPRAQQSTSLSPPRTRAPSRYPHLRPLLPTSSPPSPGQRTRVSTRRSKKQRLAKQRLGRAQTSEETTLTQQPKGGGATDDSLSYVTYLFDARNLLPTICPASQDCASPRIVSPLCSV